MLTRLKFLKRNATLKKEIVVFLNQSFVFVKVLYYISIKCTKPVWQAKTSAFKNVNNWASLVAQWLRVCLPMQGTRVRALVWEDPTCRGAARPVSHNY